MTNIPRTPSAIPIKYIMQINPCQPQAIIQIK
uniref:Uncharacterized protein n=1 Tax=Anguilla anguilla TaxID=7936 RepID=A0A0E9TPM2_ANGAN